MQGFILTLNTAAKKWNFISRLDVNFLDLTQILTKSVECEIKVKGTGSRCFLKSVSRTITMQGFILTANTAAKKLTLFLDST